MIGYLTLVALLFGQLDDNQIRVHVPKTPFECAHSRGFSFDSSGNRLIAVTQRGELLIWNDDAEKPVVKAFEKRPQDSYFDRSPMSAILTSRSEAVFFYHSGRAQVWNMDKSEKRKDLVSDRIDFGYAHVSPDAGLVAVVSHRGRKVSSSEIVFWNTRDWSSAGKIETAERINDFCFAPNGRQVIACVGHPTDQKKLGFTGIIAWNVVDQAETARIEYGTGFPIRIAVSPDGRWVATGGGDAVPTSPNSRMLSGHLRIFDWQRKAFLTEPFVLATDYVRSMQFSPDSKYLYSGSYSTPSGGGRYQAEIRTYNTADWGFQWKAELGHGNPHEITVSPNGRDILVPDEEHLQIVNAKDGVIRGTKLKFRFYPEDRAEIEKVVK